MKDAPGLPLLGDDGDRPAVEIGSGAYRFEVITR